MNAPRKRSAEVGTKSDASAAKVRSLVARGPEEISEAAAPSATRTPGGPLFIDIDLIDEDPDQPRTKDNPGFAAESIAELAASFGPTGPKSPISLRLNPDKPGRYLINHGARRTRAARAKQLAKIPAFIDNDYSEIDQVIENLQRDNLTPREIADWIGRELSRGMKKRDIARAVGKSPAFVSQHANLLNLPDTIALAFNSGRTNDVTVINELITAFKKNPNEVTAWLTEDFREITRGGVRMLREFLDEKSTDHADHEYAGEHETTPTGSPLPAHEDSAVPIRSRDGKRQGKATVVIEHKRRRGRLLFTRRPTADGYAWIKIDSDGSELEVRTADIKIKAVQVS